jgi:adenosylhomocysteine nucleosidase
MPGLAVIAALELEQRAFVAALKLQPNASIRLYRSGPGLERAALAAERAIADSSSVLMSWGLAGALEEDLPAGTLLVPGEVLLESGPSYRTAADQLDWLEESLTDTKVERNRSIVSVAHTVIGGRQKRALSAQTGAAAVDLESAAIAAAAERSGLPFVCARAIADQLDDELPAWVDELVTSAGRTNLRALWPHLIRPRSVVALARLWRRSARARASLDALARKIVRYDVDRPPGLAP